MCHDHFFAQYTRSERIKHYKVPGLERKKNGSDTFQRLLTIEDTSINCRLRAVFTKSIFIVWYKAGTE